MTAVLTSDEPTTHRPFTTLERGSRGPVLRPGCYCGWTHWERYSNADLAYQVAEAHAKEQQR